MTNYSNAFSNSFASNTFITESIPGVTDSFKQDINLSNIDFNKAETLAFNPLAFTPGLDLFGGGGGGWTFITAPEDISWDLANNAQRVDIFGTNNPPVVSGARGMRDLSLGNALVEGFVRGKQVEDKVKSLEKLMEYSINPSEGFVSVPVYQVWANEKSYGGSQAYYIIKDIKVKETMRDLSGNATRAFVDISLMQVPAYQVNSGRDQASAATAGAKSGLLEAVDQQANQNIPGKGSTTKPTSPSANAASGPKGPASKPASTKPASSASSARNRPTGVLPNAPLKFNAPPPR
jgi:hypothetical protein